MKKFLDISLVYVLLRCIFFLIAQYMYLNEYATCSLICNTPSPYRTAGRSMWDACNRSFILYLEKKQPKRYLSLLGLTILILLYLDKVCDIYCKFILCMTAVYDDHCRGCCLVVYLTELQVSVFCE
jgi:hypothetical protein